MKKKTGMYLAIGIIGIALILSLSNGAQNYINQVEEDMGMEQMAELELDLVEGDILLQEVMETVVEVEVMVEEQEVLIQQDMVEV